MSDEIFINNLKINTVIGIYSWERQINQLLLIDVKLNYDIQKAGQSDDVNDTIDYKEICTKIEEICHQTQAKLIEFLAEKICQYILEHYPCTKIELTIKKPQAIFNAESVGVKIVRQK